jgi:ABC-type antimicrobial peptide transport system permease subunit
MQTLNFVDSTGNPATVLISTKREDPRFFEFFGMDVVQGAVYPKERRNPNEAGFVVNETAMKEAGEYLSKSPYFMGVVRDMYITPTAKVMPIRFHYPVLGIDERSNDMLYFYAMAFKYEEGMRQQVHDAVSQWYHNECPTQNIVIEFDYTEDLYNVHFKSERALLTLLSIMTLACILIAVFGVYSLTSLTCQQRKKEIAIRKINGAEVLDIMNIFFKEYLILLALAALVAFPAGYIIMKRWMEGYVKQTSMDVWLYVLIFLIVFVVIVFSIVSMVWKAANQNPAEVVKKE